MGKQHSYDENISFYYMDEQARKDICLEFTVANLVDHLSEVLPRDQSHREVLLARGFFVWKVHALASDHCPSITPDSIIEEFMAFCDWPSRFPLRLCDDKKIIILHEDYSEIWKRKECANIDCIGIYGKIKAVGYQVGASEVTNRTGWNAFRGDGRWHLLHPYWCVSSVAGHSHGGRVSLEKDGITDLQEMNQSSGTMVYHFQEEHFCVEPDVFLVMHFPDDPQWQLRYETKDTVTLEEWLTMPFLWTRFFKNNLHLIGKESCRLKADNGRCRIVFSVGREFFKTLLFSYKIYLRNSDATDLSASKLSRVVLPERLENDDLFIYDIGCPVKGVYFLEVHVQDTKSNQSFRCCEFMIECDEPNPFCRKAPVDTGTLGFGFGPKAEEAGLKRPSETGAKIVMETGSDEYVEEDHIEDKKISFKVDKDAISEYEYASSMFEGEREEPVTTTLNLLTRKLVVDVPLTNNKEYALALNTRKKGSGNKYETVMYYLVTSDQEEKSDSEKLAKQITEKKKEIKMEEKAVKNTSLRKKLDEIKTAIEELENNIEQ